MQVGRGRKNDKQVKVKEEREREGEGRRVADALWKRVRSSNRGHDLPSGKIKRGIRVRERDGTTGCAAERKPRVH